MRIGVFFPTKEYAPLDEMVTRFRAVADWGFSSLWLPQSAGFDALTVLAVAGSAVPRVEFGTSVIPTYPRHPVALAAQALTVNAAVDGRLLLGLGLSHRGSIEGTYGMSYDQPARPHARVPRRAHAAARGGRGRRLRPDDHRASEAQHPRSGRADRSAGRPPAPHARARGRRRGRHDHVVHGPDHARGADRAVDHRAAATAAGRPAPRVVVALPTIVTDDDADGRAKADEQLAGYGNIPVYRAVLDREGAAGPADVSVVGNEQSVTAQLRRLSDIGATDFVAIPTGTDDDRRRTLDHLATLGS